MSDEKVIPQSLLDETKRPAPADAAPPVEGSASEKVPSDPGNPPPQRDSGSENLGAPGANAAAAAARAIDEVGGNVTDPEEAAHHADHGLAHTMPVWLLFSVLGALLALTIATVAVTRIDLGAQGNLIVAMAIATVKAALVVTFFMHLLWDRKFNLILFLTSVLFVILFLSIATTDRGEYQRQLDEYVGANPAANTSQGR